MGFGFSISMQVIKNLAQPWLQYISSTDRNLRKQVAIYLDVDMYAEDNYLQGWGGVLHFSGGGDV